MVNPDKFHTLTAELCNGVDGFVVARCLEIPGCLSQGTSREQALANLADAIELCLDTMLEDWHKQASENASEEFDGDRVPLDFSPPSVRPRSIA